MLYERAENRDMARIPPSKSAGLNAIDRVYCSHVLVHRVFDLVELRWLRRIAKTVRSAVTASVTTPMQSERVQHWSLCMLELLLADDLQEVAGRVGFDAEFDGVDAEVVRAIYGFDRDIQLATMMMVADTASGTQDGQIALSIAEALVSEFRAAPCTVRHRLANRVTSFEFPNAPVELLAWLAQLGIVTSAKYRTSALVLREAPEPSVLRAASLCELATIRSYLSANSLLSAPPGFGADLVLGVYGKYMRNGSKDQMLRFLQTQVYRHRSSALESKMMSLSAERLNNREYSASFLASANSLAPYNPFAINKQSTAVSDVGALMIGMRMARSGKALYTDLGGDSIAHEVSAELRGHGFEMHARTLHRRLIGSHREHVRDLRGYRDNLREFGIVLPAMLGDIHHYYLCAFGN